MQRWGKSGMASMVGVASLVCAAAISQPGLAGASAGAGLHRQAPAAAIYQICRSWKHHGAIAAKISAGIRDVVSQRESIVAVRVDDPFLGIGCWYRGHRHFFSASVVKATILAALLRKAHAQHRSLTQHEQDLAWLMITQSDNDAATALWNDVGMHALQRFLDLAGMKQTVLGQNGFWGLTKITAHDEMILLQHLLRPNTVLTKNARHYELYLMDHVIASQRWGVPAGAPSNFRVHVKNGWAPLPFTTSPWFINSIGCFTHLDQNYSIVVLTANNPDMQYGVTTVENVAEIINHDLHPGATSVIPRSRPFPTWGIPDEPVRPPTVAR